MKTIRFSWIALLAMCLIFSCSNEQLDNSTTLELKTTKASKNSKTVTVPFKADFFTLRDYSVSPDCSEYASENPDEDFGAPNYQVGGGKGTHLGKFTTIISFCGGPNFQYKAGEGVFVAANGDELYFNIPPAGEVGQIYQIFDDPYYELWFGDAFEFTGGTGRFAGATGGGTTDSWVDLIDGGWENFPEGFLPEHQTDHMFKGELTFYPGSKSNNH